MCCNLYCQQRLSAGHFAMPGIPNPSIVRGCKISHCLVFFSNPCSKISALFFIASSDYHSFLILTGKAPELIPSKLIGEQKGVFRKLRMKLSLCSSATVTFSSTFASFCLNRLILYVGSLSTCRYYYYYYYYYLSSVI